MTLTQPFLDRSIKPTRPEKGIHTRLFWFILLFFLTPMMVCANPANEKYIKVTILKNDTLVDLCKKYLDHPNDWETIARFNQIDNPHLIYPGETIRIPAILLKGIPINGVVTFLKGNAMSLGPDSRDWTDLHMGNPVSQGTQLKTGMESALEVTFEDGASFFLRPETTISLKTARKKIPHYIIRKLFMPMGKALMNIKKSTGQESRFEIQTPSAVSAARGTRFRVSVKNDEITRTEVLGGIVSVTGMGQEVLLDPGQGTLVKKGKAPRSPKKLLLPPSPVDLKTLYQVLPSQLKLTWIDKAVSYRTMLSTDPEFKDIVKMQEIQTSEAVRLANLEDGTYYFQTQSIDNEGLEGVPSPPKTFEIRVNPLPPFIQKPLDGQEFREKEVTLEWLKVSDAVTYQIQVAKDPEFKAVQMDFDGLKETRKKIQLNDFSKYYFRVRSIASDQFKGVWSDTIQFLFLEPPKAPPLDAPQMEEEKINIRWKNLGHDITYHFQMAMDLQFTDLIMDSTTEKSEIVFETPEKPGIYHIRISSVDSHGYEGQFTPPQNFEIKKFPYWEVGAVMSWVLVSLIIIF